VRVAFLIDEAHRSQEGKNSRAIRQPFQEKSHALIEQAEDSLEEIKKILRVHAPNQLFVAFTATPTSATLNFLANRSTLTAKLKPLPKAILSMLPRRLFPMKPCITYTVR